MTLEYIGIKCESECKIRSYIKILKTKKKVSGKLVKYYEVIQEISSDIYVPLNRNRIKEMSQWDFQG
jgi:hypothetical protein